MGQFIHLHLHSSYSFLDGYCKPKQVAKMAADLGMTAIAVTDHNHIGAAPEFQEACVNNGVKPILGCEMYWTEDTAKLALPVEERNMMAADAALKAKAITNEEYLAVVTKSKIAGIKKIKGTIKEYGCDKKGYHVLLLAMNQTGWNNLVKLQSEAAEKCTFNGRFHADTKMLKKYNDGLILTTACIGSAPATYINTGRIDEAEKLIVEWHDIFHDRMYLEIQPLCLDRQALVNRTYIEWSKKYDIPLIATNDVHYLTKNDHDDHDTLLCIGTGTKKRDSERLKYTNDFWLRTYDEMMVAFEVQADFIGDEINRNEYIAACKKAMDNTVVIADCIDNDIKLGADHDLLPHIQLPNGEDPKIYLMKMSFWNLYRYATAVDMDKETLRKYEKRLHHELTIIFNRNFEEYMLIVQEYVAWANQHGCVTGPGRGSAAGSLLLFLIGVTKMIDPIKYDLLFERFLTEDRKGLPD